MCKSTKMLRTLKFIRHILQCNLYFVKNASILLLYIAFISISSSSPAQIPKLEKQVEIESHKISESLDSLLKIIERKFEVGFLYESNVISGKVSEYQIPANGSIEEILTDLLISLKLQFIKISEDTYVIKPLIEEVSEITVSGKVTSLSDKTALPGVNVRAKETNTGTITGPDGKFKIRLNPIRENILVFSYVGYKNLEIVWGNQDEVNISMSEDQTQLSEVVVTAVGLDIDKRELGYSIQNIAKDEIIRARETNLVSAIGAKVAGVQVNSSSGAPGASASIRIRGQKSINSSNSPLFILDGMLISNTTSGNSTAGVDVSNRAIDVNPHDIKKITVLKGPAASVLYGSRAANGAIMITTNRGSVGKPSIIFSSEFALSQVNKLPAKQNKYAQGRLQDGVFIYRGPETGEVNSYGPLISELEFDGDAQYPYDTNGRLVSIGQGNGNPAIAYDDNDAFWINGKRFDQNLSVIGGSENIKYYFSLGNLYQSGVVFGTDFRRTSLKSNLDFELIKKINVGLSTSFVNSKGNRIQRGSNISGVTVGLFRNTPTFDIGNGRKGKEAYNNSSTYQLEDGTQRAYRGNALYDSPFWVASKNPFADNVNRIIGSVNMTYEILPWVGISSGLGYDYFTDSRNFAWDTNSSSEPRGRVDQSTSVSQRVNSDIYFLLDKQVSKDLAVHSTLGHNYYSQHFETKSSTGRQFAVAGFYDISNAIDITSSRSISRTKLNGVYADVRLIYRNFLFINLAGRNDWSSRLPRKNNSFFYSAASLGIELIEAINLNSKIFNQAKLRVSYGQVGNAPNIYQTQNSFNNAIIDGDNILASNEFPAFGVNAFERSDLKGNDNLKSELTSTLELGGDFSFFSSKLKLDLSYYYANTSDALVTVTLPAPTGFTSIVRNSGEIENRGYEITASGDLIESNRFRWTMNLNFTRNRSLVKSLAPEIESVTLAGFSNFSSLNMVGQPYGVFSGTRYQRNEDGILMIGSDGFPLIDPEQGIIGDPNPDWTAGIGNNIRWGQFSLSMLWDLKMGGDISNGTKGVLSYIGVSKESGDLREVTGYVFDGVHENGDKNTIKVDFADPASELSNILWRRGGFLGVAEDNIEDGSWARLREVSLSFSFPEHWADKLAGFSRIEFSVYGRNLILITNYSGIDPETNLRGPSNDQGWDFFNFPNTKSFGIVLRAQIN